MEPVDAAIEQMFARGDQLENWSDSGIDIHARVASREGGVRANVLSWSDQFGPSWAILADEPFDAVVPAGWRLIWSYGAVEAGRAAVTLVARLSPKLLLAERVLMHRNQKAWCRDRTEARLYVNPHTAGTEADLIALVMSVRMFTEFEHDFSLCSVTVEGEPGMYRDQVFDREGRRLPAMDAQISPFRIATRDSVVPARD